MADVAKSVVRDEPGGGEEEEDEPSLVKVIEEELRNLGKGWAVNSDSGWSTVEEVARELTSSPLIAETPANQEELSKDVQPSNGLSPSKVLTPSKDLSPSKDHSPHQDSSPSSPDPLGPKHVNGDLLTPVSDEPVLTLDESPVEENHHPLTNGNLSLSPEPSSPVSEASIENCNESVHEEILVNCLQENTVNEEIRNCIESVLDEVEHESPDVNNHIEETEISETTVVEKKKKKKAVGGSEATEETVTTTKKKTKKSKKTEGKENHISVIANGHDSCEEVLSPSSMSPVEDDDLSNVCVKDLKLNYVNEASKSFTSPQKSSEVPVPPAVPIRELRRSFGDIHKACEIAESVQTNNTDQQLRARSLGDLTRIDNHRKIVTGVNVKELAAQYWRTVSIENNLNEGSQKIGRLDKSSFSKFDQLSKKPVLHVRSSDPAKAQKTFSQGSPDGQTAVLCKACQKQVFAMEQIKAERAVWHKNCFRCHTCNKQLTVDIYQSHEGTLYCKPHFRELFQPKAVIDNEEEPVRRRKPEMIIRENQPIELPPEVVRASDKPDLGLEELSSLNVKSRFQVFEKQDQADGELERSPTTVSVKRSSSIMSKLAKFQKKGMDVGVTDESLNGFVYEETSSSEEESGEDEEEDRGVIKCRRKARERPLSFSKMDDVKKNWESINQSQRREEMREERKLELQQIRSRLFQGKQGKMKELYEQAVAESESKGGRRESADEELASVGEKAKLVRERFEKGEAGAGEGNDLSKKAVEEDMAVFEEGISKKSRSIFLEMEAATKAAPVIPNQPTRTDSVRRPREAYYKREPSQTDEIVRSSDVVNDVVVETADLSSRFKFFETYKEPEKQKKAFRITPPREGQVKSDSPEREVYRDPDVVRCDDKVEEESTILRSQTASRMLSVFRQLEEQKEVIPDGPKPKKCFTPPPDYKGDESSEEEGSEEDEEEETEEEEEESENEEGVVKSSYKIKDEFLEQARNAARAKQLAAKFEAWEPEKQSTNNAINMLDSEHASIESTKSLKARFESLQNEQPKEKARPKVNRFVEQPTATLCAFCDNKVYPLEKIETNGKIFHKNCFRCSYCNCILRMDTYTLNNGHLYCLPHFKQLFISKGNYDEGFGSDQHKRKWEQPVNGNTSS